MSLGLGYIRQSRHKAWERTVSPETQEAGLRALPAVQQCDRFDVYRDLDKSGKSVKKRKEFQEFLERIQAERPAVIAVYDQGRSFRNTRESLDFYALMERLPETEVVFVIGTFTRDPVGKFSYTTLAAAHEMEREMTGRKIRDARRYATSQGEMVGAVPLGYLWEGEGRERHIVLDSDWAPVVRRIFADYASGHYSTSRLARRLNAEGIRPPKFQGGWRPDTVAQLLGNVAYRGLTYSERRGKKAGTLMQANWPELVDGETWAAVERQLSRFHRGGGRRGQVTGAERVYAWQGIMRCALCGGRLQTQTVAAGTYYRCRGLEEGCGKGIRDDALEPWGRALFNWLESRQPSYFPEAVETLSEPQRTGRPPDALAQIDASLARLGKRFEWGHLGESEYLAEHGRLAALRTEIAATAATTTPERPTLNLAGLVASWDNGDVIVRREMLRALFAELTVRNGEIVSYRPHEAIAAEVARHLDGWQGAPALAV